MFIYFYECRFLTFFRSICAISADASPFLIIESRILAFANSYTSYTLSTGVSLSIYSLRNAPISHFTKNQRSDTDFGGIPPNDDKGWPMNSPS